MADASIQFLLQNLSSLVKGEIRLIAGVNNDINKLSSHLTTIQAVLQDAEDKQFEDEAIRDWLRKLNHLSFDIEDILDESVTELEKLKYKHRRTKAFRKISYKRMIATRIKQVTEKLDVVAAERAKFHLKESTVVLQSKLQALRETGSLLTNSDLVIGRAKEREDIVDFLVNKVRDLHQLSVLPIIGLGGLGKTTLAQLVFNDNRVTNHFDIKIWVCVSDDFDQKTLIKAVIASASQSEIAPSLVHLDALQQRLFQLLHQKRYLLVLDDVWNEDQGKWLQLKNQLACGKPGSSIIVTTRLKKVADIMETTACHYLEALPEESCWLLFKERAFGHEEGEHKIFEDIGWDIVKKCAGVPLAATTLGGLLRFERREEEWIRVKESPIWRLPQNESSILPALRLSYNHLPPTHRPCFAYCAVFPKDSWIGKDELIYQWMAHGYISSDGKSDVEETGDQICNELVLRSLLLNVKTDYDGKISFQMHDLVHDLAQSIMDNKVPCGPQVTLDSISISSSSIRHVNLRKWYNPSPRRIIYDDLFSIFRQFNRLRSLDASLSELKEVPPAIGKLKQLRYLNLSRNYGLEMLPEELCSLWNLKILDLSGCWELKRLPKGMRELRNLRHLFLERCWSLSQMPPKIGELTSLKTMSMFIVGEERNNQIRELQSLDHLGGKLTIINLEKVQEKQFDVNKPILAEKRNLRNLELRWKRGDTSRCRESLDEKVMKFVEPHANVKTLKIVGFEGNSIPFWTRSSSVEIKLVEICLEVCHNCKTLPQVLVEFPHLKKLRLYDLSALEYIVEDEGCDLRSVKFPALEELNIFKLDNLKGLLKKETGEFFPNLQNLHIDSSSLLSLPDLLSLQRLYIRCPSLLSLPQLPSLDNLVCSNENITSVGGNFVGLSRLTILCDRVDVGVPKEWLTNNLESLKIIYATDVDILPEEGLQNLKSLKELFIENGRCFGRWLSHLTSIEVLRLHYCDEMVDIAEEIKYLHNLKELSLHCLPKMVCLPNALQHLHALQDLSLSDLKQLESLPDWLGNFTSLNYLHIDKCPKVVSIPSCIQQLTQLNTLYIGCCSPELKKRCEKGKGDDWNKIAHIPYITIW